MWGRTLSLQRCVTERERGARTAPDTRWLRLLCLVCWCRGEALKVRNFLYDYVQETSVTRGQFLNQVLGGGRFTPKYLSLLGGIGKRNIIFIKANVQEIRIQNSGIKIKISKSFFFSFENIFCLTKFADHSVFFGGREFVT